MCAELENYQDNTEQCIHAATPSEENTGLCMCVWVCVRPCVCETERERSQVQREHFQTNTHETVHRGYIKCF